MAVIAEPALAHQVFTMPPATFRWSHPLNVLRFVVGDESMLVSDGDDHRRRRSAVLPALARRRLDRWGPVLVSRGDDLIENVIAGATASDGTVDLAPHARRATLATVVDVLFGPGMAARTDQLAELFERPQAYLESPAIKQLPHRLPLTRRAHVRKDRAAIASIVDGEIAARRRSPMDDGGLLSALVASAELTDREIRDQVITLIGAGYDTTAAMLCWVFWRATTTPGVWEKLRGEADHVFAGPVGDGLVPRLAFAAKVVKETLRLHPAGVVAPRLAATDITLAGCVIPRNTLVLPSPYLTGRDRRIWSEPLTFDPDRFDVMSEEQRAAADLAWVPFGRGPRSCIGFALAQMELTVFVARIAQHLDLVPAAPVVPPPTGLVVSRPRGGAPMRVTARDPTPG
jgi:cytochrome P450